MTPFWSLATDPDRPALVDRATGKVWSYGILARAADELASALPDRGRKTLGFLVGRNRPAAVAAYLGALRRGEAVYLANPGLAEPLQRQLVETYRPEWIVAAPALEPPPGYRSAPSPLDPHDASLCVRAEVRSDDPPPHPDLAVMLSTSGTTGSPKLVRLSSGNLQANAASIAEYLALTRDDRPIASLALHYSYGLSVVNSHLLAGGTCLLTDASVLERDYWSFAAEHGATSLAGVPFTYAALHRLRFDPASIPTLRTMTQAGGRLDPALQDHFSRATHRSGVRFFVMYGQTEATARISYVPPEELPHRLGSIGIAIPGGTLTLDGEDGEIVYRGANVMLGYAASRSDLARGDDLRGTLRTGDLGRRDGDGFFFVTGRLRRFVKLFGHRVNLDELEAAMTTALGAAAACHGSDDRLVVLVEGAGRRRDAEEILYTRFAVPPSAVLVVDDARIPRTETGKVDYPAILAAYPGA